MAVFDLTRQAMGSPRNAMANSVLSILLVMGGRLGEAEARQRLGMIALADRRPRDAVRELERALDERPVLGDAHYNLGCAWQQLGEPVKARTQFRAELKRDPGHAGALEALRALDSETVR